MSLHTDAAYVKAERLGAWAGQDYAEWKSFSSWSKRELIEAALRLGAVALGNCDSRKDGVCALADELRALKKNGII